MTVPRVLIVDDDAALLQALPRTLRLRLEPVIVDTYDSAQAALQRLATTDYDAIVSDIKMPGLDGLALLEAIQTVRPDTPTLLITGHGEHDLAIQALRGGAFDFIQKPVERDYFVASLKRAIQVRQLRRQVVEQQVALEQHAATLERAVEERTRELREMNALKDELLAQARAARDNLAFLADASALLSTSLDYATTLESLARLAVPYLADWCVVDVVGDAGAIQRLHVVHVDPAREEWAVALQHRYPPHTQRSGLIVDALATGEPTVAAEVSDEELVAFAHDDEHLRILRELGLRSYMIVPLVARQRVLGALTFVAAESGRQYGDDDVALAVQLVRRAAVAVDNARLFQQEQDAIRLRDQFLTIAAHELRTPITMVRGNTELVLRRLRQTQIPLDRDWLTTRVQRLMTGVDRLHTLAARVLDVNKLRAGVFDLTRAPCDLAALVAEVVERLRATLPAGGATTIAFAGPAGPIDGNWDALAIEQIVNNLLQNAIKYQPHGGLIQVCLQATDDEAVVRVRDRGIGIAAADLPRLFDPFTRADNAAEHQIGGAGMGLYISAQLVRLHGGAIDVTSTVGVGSEFVVRLPRT